MESVKEKLLVLDVDVRHIDARRPVPNARGPAPNAQRPTPACSASTGREDLTRRFLVGRGSLKEHIMYLDFPVILYFSQISHFSYQLADQPIYYSFPLLPYQSCTSTLESCNFLIYWNVIGCISRNPTPFRVIVVFRKKRAQFHHASGSYFQQC